MVFWAKVVTRRADKPVAVAAAAIMVVVLRHGKAEVVEVVSVRHQGHPQSPIPRASSLETGKLSSLGRVVRDLAFLPQERLSQSRSLRWQPLHPPRQPLPQFAQGVLPN